MFNKDNTLNILERIVNVPSPTGFCNDVLDEVEKIVAENGYKLERQQTGSAVITIDGEDNSYCIGIPVHVDTLGFMVRSVNSDGTLRITELGGNMYSTVDGEYCKIHTRQGKEFTGTILCTSPAVHVFPDARTKERIEENMMVRIDQVTYKKEETEALGIGNGDFVSVEPKYTVTESGYVKSRYLDDKAGVACALSLLEIFNRTKTKPKYRVKIIISIYEEIGHGCSWIPEDINELLGIDMGCIGLDLACNEEQVSICAKDRTGPYDFNMVNKLIDIAKEKKLGYVVDVYPFYGSDVSAAQSGGNKIRGALIGPGINASHGMERTHIRGIENTVRLIHGYVTEA